MPAEPSKLQPVPFPFGGVDYFDAYADGNPMGGSNKAPVTQGAMNVRGVDMGNSRRRGSGRQGTNKYCPIQIPPFSSAPVQEIASFIASRTDASVGTGQLAMNLLDHNTGATGFSLLDSKFQVYDTDKSLSSTHNVYNLAWDINSPNGKLYQTGTNTATGKFFIRAVSSIGVQVWYREFGTTSGYPYIPMGISLAFTIALAVAVHSSGANAYEVWYFNIFDGSDEEITNPILNSSIGSGPGKLGNIASSYNCLAVDASTSRLAILEGAGCRIVNLATNVTVGVTGTANGGTLTNSWRVVTNGAGSFYRCVQEDDTGIIYNTIDIINSSAVSTGNIRLPTTFNAQGADISYNPTNTELWAVFYRSSSNGIFKLSPADLSTLLGGPINNPLGNANTKTMLLTYPGGSHGGLILFSYVNSANQNSVYGYQMSTASPPVAMQLAVFWQDNSNFPYLYGAVNYAANPANPTAFYNAYTYIAVGAGVVTEFTSEIAWHVGNATGGTGLLSTTANVIFSAQQGDSLYFADGISTIYYDSISDRIKTWTAAAGSLPVDLGGNYPRLICLWRNRIVQAGLLDDASNWFMSAVGDATNWDYAPATEVATQAVAGNNSLAGEVGDVINTLIPYNDDLLIFGGNNSIWQMTGDPMTGGQIDLISNITGMPFGRPWCIDPAANIYFVGSRGGVFTMLPGTKPQRISTLTIDAFLEKIDYDTVVIRMAWDDLEQGFHLYVTPIIASGTVTHFWYDARNQAWWPDQFGNTNYDPQAICILTGNHPRDRVILMGGRDGYLRKYDPTVFTDDLTAISNNVLIGPYYNVRVDELQVTLAADSGTVTVQVLVGANAEAAIAASPVWSSTFSVAGRNRSQNPLVFGNVVYLNVVGTGKFSIEQLIARFKPGNNNRQRIF